MLELEEAPAEHVRMLAGHYLHSACLAARLAWTERPDHTVAAEDSQQECEEVL